MIPDQRGQDHGWRRPLLEMLLEQDGRITRDDPAPLPAVLTVGTAD